MYRTCTVMLSAAALAVAGCGGGDAGKPLTKARFVTQAAAVCRDVKKAHQPYADKVDKLPQNVDIGRVAPLLEATLEQSRKGLARLRALDSPPADQRTLAAYYRAAERLLDAHAQLADAARTDDRATGEKVAASVGALSDDERRLANAYGLKDCDNVF
jgi:hypothetical protein